MLPEIFIWAVVFAIGVPSAWRNPTAAALVISWIFGELVYLFSGNNLPIDFYLYPDILVLAVIMAKPEACNLRPYRNVWHQLSCVLLERSPADRMVMLSFPACWATYVADISDYSKWWILFGIVVLQFLFASAESLEKFWRSRSMPRGETKRGSNTPAPRDRFVEIRISPQVQRHAAMGEACSPTSVFLVPRYTRFARLIVRVLATVRHVCSHVAVPQVCNAVVRRAAINVVDVARGPAPIVERPCGSVSVYATASYLGAPVTEPVDRRKSLFACVPSNPRTPNSVAGEVTSWSRQPKQFAALRLIAEKLTKRFRGGYFSDSHCALLSREGQGRTLFPQRFRPAFLSTNHAPTQRCAAAADAPAMLVACGDRGYG